jgi:nephrocystin-3
LRDNRRIRVFVSSTFRDMVEERDELMTQTWPELRRFCRERQVEFVEVDLRWGIAEEQSTRKETLKLCLDEIRHCRPFFVGLLGERYGWTPGEDAFTADLKEEQPWLNDLSGKSVTELEILHGVLNNPEMAHRSFFYFRDPACAQAHGANFLPEDAETAGKQAALKEAIRRICADKHIPLREDYPDPRTLATFVHGDLMAAIAEQFPIENIPDPLTREARDHEALAEARRRTYIGRPDYFERLDRHAAGDGAPLVVLGDSGSGKSALLANWLDHWRRAHPGDFIFQHYIGGTRDSAEHWRLMARLIVEIKRWSGDPDEQPRSHDDLLRDFPVWLAKARLKAERDGVRFIAALDALNQLEDCDHARLLGWLPSHPFRGPLRLILSTLPMKLPEDDPQRVVDDPFNVVAERGWETLRVQPLQPDERRRMIADYLKRFGKTLDASRLDRLSAVPAAANPLYLRILLDELRVTGTHERLDERLGNYLEAPDIPALLKHVLARHQRDYQRDRPELVGDALGLIWAARRGLTETEILRLLKPAGLPHLPLATWSPLRAALEEWLVDRSGILNFAHDFLRAAVETAFVPDRRRRNQLRLQLADDFEQQPVTARGCDELPWLLQQAESFVRLRACLLDVDRFLEILKRSPEELMLYWVNLREAGTMARPYLDSFEQWSRRPRRDEAQISFAANELGFFLVGYAALHADAEPLVRRALAMEERSSGPRHPAVAVRLGNLAQILRVTNRLDEAEPLMRRALAIDEQSFGPVHRSVALRINNLALLLQDLGLSRQDTARLAEAEPLYRRALAIEEQNFGPDHPTVANVLNNLGVLLDHRGRLDEAEPLYRRALPIYERNFGPVHPQVAAVLNNLAEVLLHTGRLDEAELLYRRALAIDEQAFGPQHLSVAIKLHNLALLLEATTRLDEADQLMRRSVNIYLEFTRAAGRRHPHHQTVVQNYISIQRMVATFRQFDSPQLSPGDEGPDQTLAHFEVLADHLEKIGRTDEARALRDEHDLIAEAQNSGGGIRELLGEPQRDPAEMTGADEPAARRTAALLAYKLGDYDNAELILRSLIMDGFEVPGTRCHLGRILMVQDRFDEAVPQAAAAWEARADAPSYVIPRILWLQLALLYTLPDGESRIDSAQAVLGRLKTALARENAHMEWVMDPVLARLQPRLPAGQYQLLTALVAALSDATRLQALAQFPVWRDAQPEPLE